MPGRHSLKTEHRIQAILESIRACNTKRAAARVNGISEDTLQRWLDEDEHFALRFAQAEAEAEASLVGKMVTAGEKDAKWVSWMLKSRHGWQESPKQGGPENCFIFLYLPHNQRDNELPPPSLQ